MQAFPLTQYISEFIEEAWPSCYVTSSFFS